MFNTLVELTHFHMLSFKKKINCYQRLAVSLFSGIPSESYIKKQQNHTSNQRGEARVWDISCRMIIKSLYKPSNNFFTLEFFFPEFSKAL